MNKLCVDIDNVLSCTDETIRRVIGERTNKRVNLEYEDIIEFDYYKCFDCHGNSITKDEWNVVHSEFSEPANILSLKPMDFAISSLSILSRHYDIHLATTRLPRARKATIEWLELHGLLSLDTHFLKHGEKHATMVNFFAAIEDHYEQAVAFVKSGTICYLIDHPWNRSKPPMDGIIWVNNWSELCTRLLSSP